MVNKKQTNMISKKNIETYVLHNGTMQLKANQKLHEMF